MPPDLVSPTRPADRRAGDDALQLITDSLTDIAGWGVAVLGVVRGEYVEMVAVAGDDDARAELLGSRMPTASTLDETATGQDWGRFKFVPHGISDAGPQDWEWVPDIVPLDHPDAWHPFDLLLAPLCDADGTMRGTLSIDIPPDGMRPGPEQQRLLEKYAEQAERALLAALEREELAEQVRLADAARRMVRDALGQRSLERIFETCQSALMEGFGATATWVHAFDDDGLASGSVQMGGRPGTDLPEDLLEVVEQAARHAWAGRTAYIVTPDAEVAGFPGLAQETAERVLGFLRDADLGSVLFVPLGAGRECLGSLVLSRGPQGRAWAEVEVAAAREIGRDLGGAILTVRAYEREHELVKKLQALDTYKSELIATVSHEQKTPLTAILGHLEMLGDEESLLPHVRRSVTAMDRAAHRLSKVIEDLLLLSKVADPTTPITARPVDLRAVVADVVDLTAVAAERRRLTVTVDAPAEPVVTLGDADELDRVLANLVSNAVKYTPEGRSVRVSLHAAAGGEVQVECRDEGIGISQSDQAQLFTEFFRSADPAALAQPGTGLGLAIVARIVERHQGRIEVESELGRGSMFRVVLPAA